MERCWLDLRNTASISSSSWGKQFCAGCFLGEAWENNMKMTSFLFFLLHNKHIWCSQANAGIKAKLKPFFFSRPCAKMPFLFLFHFFTIVSAYFLLNPISLCDGEYKDVRCLLQWWMGLGAERDPLQMMLTDINVKGEGRAQRCADLGTAVTDKLRLNVCGTRGWNEGRRSDKERIEKWKCSHACIVCWTPSREETSAKLADLLPTVKLYKMSR